MHIISVRYLLALANKVERLTWCITSLDWQKSGETELKNMSTGNTPFDSRQSRQICTC